MIIANKVKISTTDMERSILDAIMVISRKVHNYFPTHGKSFTTASIVLNYVKSR
ncbi:hypothetical protein [Acidianus sp. RZ1]|uniref:hypothetical protein n=1 Tax=Acidianus sp. RZ1 TaxID=1540082 RepID=UPI0014911447|nr:hypothetical protein [Acidianus sp. RZ1]NON61740.1 hypothetical protein [Acidianus sp. RZ1]